MFELGGLCLKINCSFPKNPEAEFLSLVLFCQSVTHFPDTSLWRPSATMLLPSDDAFVTFTLHSRTQQLRQGGLERHRLAHRKHVELRRLTRGHFERRSILQNDLLFRAAFARSQSSCQWDDLITTKNVYLVNNEQPYRPATKVAVNVNKQISSKCRESNYSAFLFFVEILDSFNHIRVVRRLDQITQRVKRKCQAESKPVCADRPLWP